MGLDVGGFEQKPDFPKMGPSLLIAACVILAIRTAKWAIQDRCRTAGDTELDAEIDQSVYMAGRVLSRLVSRHEAMFPSKRVTWFNPDGEDQPK